MAVEIDELPGSPIYTYSQGKAKIKRKMLLDWADVVAFTAELVPEAYAAGASLVNPGGASFLLLSVGTGFNSLYRIFNGDSRRANLSNF